MSRVKTPTSRRGEHGSIFLLSIVVLTVLFLLGASLVQRAQTAIYRASIDSASAKSFRLAEVDIHTATWALNPPNGWLTYTGESAALLPGGFARLSVGRTSSDAVAVGPEGEVNGTVVVGLGTTAPCLSPDDRGTISTPSLPDSVVGGSLSPGCAAPLAAQPTSHGISHETMEKQSGSLLRATGG